MLSVKVIQTYNVILRSYRKLQISITVLIQASGAKHQEIWKKLGFAKDTFYRRLRNQNWTNREMQVLVPFLVRKTKANNPELYEKIAEKLPDEEAK